jgi:hypothetical protein
MHRNGRMVEPDTRKGTLYITRVRSNQTLSSFHTVFSLNSRMIP